MNLVIDDAVEVQLATRDAPEKRRQLGEETENGPSQEFLLIAVQGKFY